MLSRGFCDCERSKALVKCDPENRKLIRNEHISLSANIYKFNANQIALLSCLILF
jgi:hypothetical protein